MIWEGNLDYIEKHNLAADRGDYSFWLGMNEYGDMVSESRDLLNTGATVSGLVWTNTETVIRITDEYREIKDKVYVAER